MQEYTRKGLVHLNIMDIPTLPCKTWGGTKNRSRRKISTSAKIDIPLPDIIFSRTRIPEFDYNLRTVISNHKGI
jgi:hypothetical protein